MGAEKPIDGSWKQTMAGQTWIEGAGKIGRDPCYWLTTLLKPYCEDETNLFAGLPAQITRFSTESARDSGRLFADIGVCRRGLVL